MIWSCVGSEWACVYLDMLDIISAGSAIEVKSHRAWGSPVVKKKTAHMWKKLPKWGCDQISSNCVSPNTSLEAPHRMLRLSPRRMFIRRYILLQTDANTRRWNDDVDVDVCIEQLNPLELNPNNNNDIPRKNIH